MPKAQPEAHIFLIREAHVWIWREVIGDQETRLFSNIPASSTSTQLSLTSIPMCSIPSRTRVMPSYEPRTGKIRSARGDIYIYPEDRSHPVWRAPVPFYPGIGERGSNGLPKAFNPSRLGEVEPTPGNGLTLISWEWGEPRFPSALHDRHFAAT